VHQLLKKYWGHNQFRPLQEDIIKSVLNGHDTLALLPTGGGKSICFQIPALASEGMCLVISPLVALMKDQVENLKSKGISACLLYSGLSRREIYFELENCLNNKYKFLYVSPERLSNDEFLGYLKNMNLNLIAVDEAHCISQWGYDFRPEYLKINAIRPLFKVPVIALTASATAMVVNDIAEKLNFKNREAIFRRSFYRPNLNYLVLNEPNKTNRIFNICSKTKGTGLIYVRNRKKTSEISKALNNSGIKADYYHAGLSIEIRTRKQQSWKTGETRIMVCTNAFGMGIDKPDVRFVIHYEMPDGLESYYQEAGRAGRDEKESYCILLYDINDGIEAQNKLLMQYPSKEYIEQVYQSLCNYFQIGMHSGKGTDHPFELSDFCEKFNLRPSTVFSTLEILHKSEYILFSQGVEKPSRVRVLVNNIELYDFQIKNPSLDDFIKTLLRSYGGSLFDNYVKIDEYVLAKRLKTQANLVTQTLKRLHQLNIIEFHERSDLPQITYLHERFPQTGISLEQLEQSKERSLERLRALTLYCETGIKCRSLQILHYFDETSDEICGKCDVCRKLKKEELEIELFEKLVGFLKNELLDKMQSTEELCNKIGLQNEKKLIKVIRWLLDEGHLKMLDNQTLVWLKKE
jgi:ATP-dependent DNA helicase RecQ